MLLSIISGICDTAIRRLIRSCGNRILAANIVVRRCMCNNWLQTGTAGQITNTIEDN